MTRSANASILPFRGQHYWFLVDRILGLVAVLNGEWDVAAVHLAEAEAIAQREGLLPELARTLLGQVDVVLALKDQDYMARARYLLKRALALFEKLQMLTSADRTRGRLLALAGKPTVRCVLLRRRERRRDRFRVI